MKPDLPVPASLEQTILNEHIEDRSMSATDYYELGIKEPHDQKRREYLREALNTLGSTPTTKRQTLRARICLALLDVENDIKRREQLAASAYQAARSEGITDDELRYKTQLALITTAPLERRFDFFMDAINEHQNILCEDAINALTTKEQHKKLSRLASILKGFAQYIQHLTTESKTLYLVQGRLAQNPIELRHELLEPLANPAHYTYSRQKALSGYLFELARKFTTTSKQEQTLEGTLSLLEIQIEFAKQQARNGKGAEHHFRKAIDYTKRSKETFIRTAEHRGDAYYHLGRIITPQRRIFVALNAIDAYEQAIEHTISERTNERGELQPDSKLFEQLARQYLKLGWTGVRLAENLTDHPKEEHKRVLHFLKREGYHTLTPDKIPAHTIDFAISSLETAKQWGKPTAETFSKLGFAYHHRATILTEERNALIEELKNNITTYKQTPSLTNLIDALEDTLNITIPKTTYQRIEQTVTKTNTQALEHIIPKLIRHATQSNVDTFTGAFNRFYATLQYRYPSKDHRRDVLALITRHPHKNNPEILATEIIDLFKPKKIAEKDIDRLKISEEDINRLIEEIKQLPDINRYHHLIYAITQDTNTAIEHLDDALHIDKTFLTPLYKKITILSGAKSHHNISIDLRQLWDELLDHLLDNPLTRSRTGLTRRDVGIVSDEYYLMQQQLVLKLMSTEELERHRLLLARKSLVPTILHATNHRAPEHFHYVFMKYHGENLYSQTQRVDQEIRMLYTQFDKHTPLENKIKELREPIIQAHFLGINRLVKVNNDLVALLLEGKTSAEIYHTPEDYIKRFDLALFDNKHVNPMLTTKTLVTGDRAIKQTAKETLDIDIIDNHSFKFRNNNSVYTSPTSLLNPLSLLRLATLLYIVPQLTNQPRGVYSDSNSSNHFGDVIGDKERLKVTHWSEDPAIFLHMRPTFTLNELDMFYGKLFERRGKITTLTPIEGRYKRGKLRTTYSNLRKDMLYAGVAKMLTLIGHEHKKIGEEIPRYDDHEQQNYWYEEATQNITSYHNQTLIMLRGALNEEDIPYNLEGQLPCGITEREGLERMVTLLTRIHFITPDALLSSRGELDPARIRQVNAT